LPLSATTQKDDRLIVFVLVTIGTHWVANEPIPELLFSAIKIEHPIV